MQMETLQKNADRFTGFARIYDQARPAVPEYPVAVIEKYLGRKPRTVVDLGSGTGLSTQVWKNCGVHVIGIEPSDDMLMVAKQRECDGVSFCHGFGNDTGLEAECADAVTCSQSFHWMEPKSTLQEVERILKSGGVFATIDCDWPPVTEWRAEQAYMELYERICQLEKDMPDLRDSFVRYPKERHLANLKASGFFRYCREITFANTEDCTADRLIELLLSQGSLQTILKLHPQSIERELSLFRSTMKLIFGSRTFSVDFCYRMRVAVK